VLGYERRLSESLRLLAELYHQDLFDVPVIADSSFSLLNLEQDLEFDAALANGGAGRNSGIELTLERFFADGYYFLATGTLFRSRYRGGDGIWRGTRFDRGLAANLLFGRELTVARDDLLAVNGRLSVAGGKRRSPLDEAASMAAEDVVYDESRAFALRERGTVVFDLTLTWRRNHAGSSEIWALQIKNLLGAKDRFLDYNFASERVERVAEGFPLPVLSWKIEF
jgi:hypothetical protein